MNPLRYATPSELLDRADALDREASDYNIVGMYRRAKDLRLEAKDLRAMAVQAREFQRRAA